MLLGISSETYLRRDWDVQRDFVTTSPRRLVAGWVVTTTFLNPKISEVENKSRDSKH